MTGPDCKVRSLYGGNLPQTAATQQTQPMLGAGAT